MQQRTRHHLAGHPAVDELLLLLFDAVVLAMLLPTPGHAHLWVEKELKRIFETFRTHGANMGTLACRLLVDFIGLDLNMVVMTTKGVNNRVDDQDELC